MNSDNGSSQSDSQSTQIETAPAKTTIQTDKGKHKINKDNPVRIGNLSTIDSYHTRACMYVKNANIEDIKPVSQRTLTFHSDTDECDVCEEIRSEE